MLPPQTYRSVPPFAIKANVVPSLSQSPMYPHGPRQHHPSHRVRHCGRYKRSSCPTVCRLRNDPPLRGQWPPRAGSLALRRPCGRLVLGRRPLSCFPSHTPRGSNGGDQGPGNRKTGVPPVFFVPCVFLSANIFPFMSARRHSV
jgi:hypothetical protein